VLLHYIFKANPGNFEIFRHRMIRRTILPLKSWWSMLPSRRHRPESWWSVWLDLWRYGSRAPESRPRGGHRPGCPNILATPTPEIIFCLRPASVWPTVN